MLLLLHVASAFAQDAVTGGEAPPLNAQNFRPSIDSHTFFRVMSSDLPEQRWSANGLLSYTIAPLQYTTLDGESTDIVGNLVQLDAMAAYRIGAVRFGLDLPIYLRSFGGTSTDATGLGDLSLDGKVRILDPSKAPIGLAGVVRVAVPVSTVPEGLGAGGAGADIAVALDKPVGERVTLALNLGTSLMPAVALENIDWGSQLFGTLGVSGAVTDRVGILGELHAATVMTDFGNAQGTPVEALVGGWGRLGPDGALLLRPGLGFGLTDAISSPRMRAMVALGWDPMAKKAPPDRDKDGILDASDACPDIPEDMDQWEDTDGCAEPTEVTVRIVDGDNQPVVDGTFAVKNGPGGKAGDKIKLEAGTYDFTADATTVQSVISGGAPATVEIRVPAPRGTLHVEAKDKAGQPIATAIWSARGPTKAEGKAGDDVKVRPGTYEVTGSAPGYRDATVKAVVEKDGTATLMFELLPSKAELKVERIEIKESVYFETAKFDIKAESFPLLDEIAEILVKHTEITKVRVEGNTDSRGSATSNQKLSQGRAEAVRTYLANKGVAAERIEAIGYGESKPLVKGENEAAWSKNRRVDFMIVERSDGTAGEIKRIELPPDRPKDK